MRRELLPSEGFVSTNERPLIDCYEVLPLCLRSLLARPRALFSHPTLTAHIDWDTVEDSELYTPSSTEWESVSSALDTVFLQVKQLVVDFDKHIKRGNQRPGLPPGQTDQYADSKGFTQNDLIFRRDVASLAFRALEAGRDGGILRATRRGPQMVVVDWGILSMNSSNAGLRVSRPAIQARPVNVGPPRTAGLVTEADPIAPSTSNPEPTVPIAQGVDASNVDSPRTSDSIQKNFLDLTSKLEDATSGEGVDSILKELNLLQKEAPDDLRIEISKLVELQQGRLNFYRLIKQAGPADTDGARLDIATESLRYAHTKRERQVVQDWIALYRSSSVEPEPIHSVGTVLSKLEADIEKIERGLKNPDAVLLPESVEAFRRRIREITLDSDLGTDAELRLALLEDRIKQLDAQRVRVVLPRGTGVVRPGQNEKPSFTSKNAADALEFDVDRFQIELRNPRAVLPPESVERLRRRLREMESDSSLGTVEKLRLQILGGKIDQLDAQRVRVVPLGFTPNNPIDALEFDVDRIQIELLNPRVVLFPDSLSRLRRRFREIENEPSQGADTDLRLKLLEKKIDLLSEARIVIVTGPGGGTTGVIPRSPPGGIGPTGVIPRSFLGSGCISVSNLLLLFLVLLLLVFLLCLAHLSMPCVKKPEVVLPIPFTPVPVVPVPFTPVPVVPVPVVPVPVVPVPVVPVPVVPIPVVPVPVVPIPVVPVPVVPVPVVPVPVVPVPVVPIPFLPRIPGVPIPVVPIPVVPAPVVTDPSAPEVTDPSAPEVTDPSAPEGTDPVLTEPATGDSDGTPAPVGPSVPPPPLEPATGDSDGTPSPVSPSVPPPPLEPATGDSDGTPAPVGPSVPPYKQKSDGNGKGGPGDGNGKAGPGDGDGDGKGGPGDGGGKGGPGDGDGKGGGGGGGVAGKDKKTTFCGVTVKGKSVVYLLDCSKSMKKENWKEQLRLLEESLQETTAEKFAVVFFSSTETAYTLQTGEKKKKAYDSMNDPPKFLDNTKPNIVKVMDWAKKVDVEGGTDPTEAIGVIFSGLDPESLIFTSDGVFNELKGKKHTLIDNIPDLILQTKNNNKKIEIATFLYPLDYETISDSIVEGIKTKEVAEQIAEETMKMIADPDKFKKIPPPKTN